MKKLICVLMLVVLTATLLSACGEGDSSNQGESNESVEMRYEDENIWLTQKMMAVLYDVDIRTINEHIKRVFSDRELPEDPTIRKFRIVQTEGTRQVTRDALHYNLEKQVKTEPKNHSSEN